MWMLQLQRVGVSRLRPRDQGGERERSRAERARRAGCECVHERSHTHHGSLPLSVQALVCSWQQGKWMGGGTIEEGAEEI